MYGVNVKTVRESAVPVNQQPFIPKMIVLKNNYDKHMIFINFCISLYENLL